jgi:hypothetical protein
VTDLERAIADGGQVSQSRTAPQTDLDRAIAAGGQVYTPEKPGALESVARGAVQGATMGFADEISGAIESLLSGKSYEQARDESRANFKAANDAHPWLSLAGNVVGSVPTALLPGGGVAKLATAGAISGIGGSEAKDAAGVLSDAATGAVIGGGLGVAGKALGKIPGAINELDPSKLAGSVSKSIGAGAGGVVGGPVGAVIGSGASGLIEKPVTAAISAAKGAAQSQLSAAAQKIAQLTQAAQSGNQHAQLLLKMIDSSPEIAARIASLEAVE